MPVNKRRYPRVVQACNTCRAKKYKCDGHLPCFHCQRLGRECIFQGEVNSHSPYSIRYVKDLEKSLERAEAALHIQGIPQLGNTDPKQTGSVKEHVVVQQSQLNVLWPSESGDSTIDSIAGAARQGAAPVDIPNKEAPDDISTDVMDINGVSRRFEFHGRTSSLAFLDRLMKLKERNSASRFLGCPILSRQAVIEFQNEAFMKFRETLRVFDKVQENYYPHYAFLFIDSYFKTLHYVHPILDQHVFLERCSSLWTGRGISIHQSFKVLYFAVLSLGALTRTWIEDSINGMDRNTWALMLFERAELAMGRLGSLNDLEAVQAAMIMAQVCQHQLNPNLAYTYLGTALRTSFSMGINRIAPFRTRHFPQDSPSVVVSRTWWDLYSMETELSITLGRENMLGLDSYHNRPPPLVSVNNESENTIISVMLGLSRILQEISRKIYWEETALSEKLERAGEYERRLNSWLVELPPNIRPKPFSGATKARLLLGNHYWPELQRLVLHLRYLHTRIVLFYVFFLHEQKGHKNGRDAKKVAAYSANCKNAAVEIIECIHSTYSAHHFFRSWWNNTTYIAFGLSILVATFSREPAIARPKSAILLYINQAIEVLGVMDECPVACNIGKFIRELVDTLLATGTSRNDSEGEPQAE
ncbi:hypothetical protein P152DRAFT_462900 [Eremomyces bilateralis CBS 781.70]|uniref:Zn(2)-C6 fungal-type domain-containing protein n=1 Tax=Eremomyces bilateralis CBS 781.70 TaxID=1392243 RepID=A0A6G1FQI5_9PEZI|nr:uncharacterized protein P152DRAFT_462900 [Eremomyces bilateralis CBS 781.70]KAF1808095.1 hypothetical protein P152DRAFT_462900 [Eremomyces bilateralis CBS 781.70]